MVILLKTTASPVLLRGFTPTVVRLMINDSFRAWVMFLGGHKADGSGILLGADRGMIFVLKEFGALGINFD